MTKKTSSDICAHLEFSSSIAFSDLACRFFYIDAVHYAKDNGLEVNNDDCGAWYVMYDNFIQARAITTPSLKDVERKIKDHGGRIVDLIDPRLTHVIFDPEDTTRRLQIRQRIRRHVFSSSG